MITLNHINKSFRVAKRNSGFGNAVKALFSREHETIHALSDVGFTIRDGEMVGYIGPNGAGKSTTIKIMCGILTPDSGTCDINGRTPWKQRLQHVRDIGVVFGQRSQLWWDVPVADSFELIRDIYEVDEKIYCRNLDEMVELLNLSEILKTPTRSLSLGQRMRCEIAASLLHNPKILFLDEPTIGLDAISKIAVRQFIKKLNAEHKTTVILTTHDMMDIEALTERILLIGKGRILLDGKLNELLRRSSHRKTLTVDYMGTFPSLSMGMTLLEQKEGRIVVAIDPSVVSVSDSIASISSQVEVLDISAVSFSTFLGIYFMFSRFSTVEGFTYQQVLLCFAAVLMAFSIAECFGRGFDLFPRMISNGEFDRVLVRPKSEVFLVLASQIELTRIGRLLQAVIIFCYALPASGIIWTWNKILVLFLMVSCGSIIFFGLFLVYAAFSFFTIEGLEFMNILTDGGREFGRYPFSVYGQGVLKFLTYVIPLALFQYYPLLYLIGRNEDVFHMIIPLFGLVFLIPCYMFWRYGLRKYKSTGS